MPRISTDLPLCLSAFHSSRSPWTAASNHPVRSLRKTSILGAAATREAPRRAPPGPPRPPAFSPEPGGDQLAGRPLAPCPPATCPPATCPPAPCPLAPRAPPKPLLPERTAAGVGCRVIVPMLVTTAVRCGGT